MHFSAAKSAQSILIRGRERPTCIRQCNCDSFKKIDEQKSSLLEALSGISFSLYSQGTDLLRKETDLHPNHIVTSFVELEVKLNEESNFEDRVHHCKRNRKAGLTRELTFDYCD